MYPEFFNYQKYAEDKGLEIYEVGIGGTKNEKLIAILGRRTLDIFIKMALQYRVHIRKFYIRWPGHKPEDMGIFKDE